MSEDKDQTSEEKPIPKVQKVIAIIWPSFLTAGIATIIFFTMFDPDVILAHTRFAGTSRLGAYSTGFFSFWALTLASCCLTCYYRKHLKHCKECNHI